MAKLAKERTVSKIDELIGCGWYQVMLVVFVMFFNFACSFNMVAMMVFSKVEPTWTCDDWNEDPTAANLTVKEACKRYENSSCKNITMESDFYSVAWEFGLICSGLKTVLFSMSVQMFGVLISSPVFGQLSDLYGRKWILLTTTALQLITGIASAFSTDMTMFIVWRFFIGIFCGGSLVVGYVYFNEFLTARHRFWVSGICSWSIPYAFFAVIAWAVADWRTYTIIGNVIPIPAVLMLCFMKESPRWLLQKGKLVEAERSFAFIAKFNRTANAKDVNKLEAMIENAERALEKEQKNKKHYVFWHLFSNRKLAMETVVFCICYFVISTISYGIVYDTSSLAGSRFLNFFIYAVIRYAILGITVVADTLFKWCGRKTIFLFSMGSICACCTAIAILKVLGHDKTLSVSILAITAGVLTAAVWNALGTAATETFPTPIRNVGNGFCGVFNRLGLVITPLVLYLAVSWPPASYIIFAALAGLACILNFIVIPETKGHPLPETMPDSTVAVVSNGKFRSNNRSSTIRSESFTMYKFNEPKEQSESQ